MANEFSGRDMACVPEQLVPQGPGIDPAFQGCSLTGAQINANAVSGASYLEAACDYSRHDLWRNFGVVIAFSVLYILVTVAATELSSLTSHSTSATVFKKSRKVKKVIQNQHSASTTKDEEKGLSGTSTEVNWSPAGAGVRQPTKSRKLSTPFQRAKASSPGKMSSTRCPTKAASASC